MMQNVNCRILEKGVHKLTYAVVFSYMHDERTMVGKTTEAGDQALNQRMFLNSCERTRVLPNSPATTDAQVYSYP
jgi:hypothetical protein